MSLLDPALLRPALLRPALLRRGLLRRGLVAAAAALVAWLAAATLAAPPAAAHPFGDPQTVEVAGTGDGEVRVRWRAGAGDDLTALAQHLGLLPAERVLLDGAVLTEPGDADLLAGSDALSGYLLGHVRVTADGRGCPGRTAPVADLAVDGVDLLFACGTGAPVGAAEVEVTTLTDLHPAYRTLATGPDGQRAAYDAGHPVHAFALADGTGGGTRSSAAGAALQMGGVLGLAGAAGVGGAFWVRRRGRRTEPTAVA
ncbi:hypothetical protein [Nocardioides litoris]|uniref:hypothetical protein n=1 Tax=Nocardioides litoris TaxID=1926648 RepID=UPI001B87D471|nr:hypothetical protein [Nocardioides litoris]